MTSTRHVATPSAQPLRPLVPRRERRRHLDGAWHRFVQDGAEPIGVSGEIERSWREARDRHRIDPAMTRPRLVLSPDELAERCARDEVYRLATPILRDFASRLGLSEHVLAYLDAEGYLLSLDGDRAVVEQAQGIHFHPGYSWAEESAGTNGPGTALAEGRPVEVFASEHFVAAWQSWTCAAAPVRGPGDATPLGLVDISAPWEVQRRHALLIAKAIARAIEERLRAAVALRDEVVRYAFKLARQAGDAMVAVDARSRVIAVNDAAARGRLVEAGALPAPLRASLADALRASSARLDADVPLDGGGGPTVVASPVLYDGAPVGAILRRAARASAAHAGKAAPPPRGRPAARYDFGAILGRSPCVRGAVELARTVSQNDLPVVLFGESGTGKELFAHAIHAACARRGGPFVAVNCGSIPAQLVEAELFGYEAGTFTGARREGNPGRFEDACGGTLFLDEVSELPPPAQTALLRVLQEREVVRLGGSTPRPVDVRVVAATNKPLEEEIRAHRFRRDLYYRLSVLSISVPPLRQRGDDVVQLAQVFLAGAEAEVGRRGLTFSPDAMAALVAHPWPGNVRELKNVVLRAAATAPAAQIRASDLSFGPGTGERPAPDAPDVPDAPAALAAAAAPCVRGTLQAAVDESERAALVEALGATGWNVVQTARRLGVSRMTLYRRIAQYGLSRPAVERAR